MIRAALLTVALAAVAAAVGCDIKARSSFYRCEAPSDCTDGRVCANGWCVAGDGSDTDGAPVSPADAASIPEPDAAPVSEPDAAPVVCPASCTKCDNDVCIIECDRLRSCAAGVVCPPGMDCVVSCGGLDSCGGDIDCTDATSCDLSCGGSGACAGRILCGPKLCIIECDGQDSCSGEIDCSESCACDTYCFGDNSCFQKPDCPAGCINELDLCDSTEPDCGTCE